MQGPSQHWEPEIGAATNDYLVSYLGRIGIEPLPDDDDDDDDDESLVNRCGEESYVRLAVRECESK